LKICIVASVFPRYPEDLEVPWFRQIVRRCREKGLDIHVYAPAFRGLKDHEIDGIPVHRFRYFFKPWETLTGEEGAPNKIHKLHYKIITLFYILFGTAGLIRFHLKMKFDIIHVHWPFPHAIFGIAAVFFRKARLLLNFYLASILLMHKFAFVKKFLYYFIGKADRIIAISNYTAKQVQEIRPCEVALIPYGAAIEYRAVSPEKKSDEKIILSVGRMIERKGFTYAIQAMPRVLADEPGARLYLVGGGPLIPQLQEQSKELGIEHAVHLPGKVSNEELQRLFSSCEMFILPSIIDSRGDTEGLGVVLIEALSYKKPVIASAVGGIPDIVIHENTGLLVPQKDPEALAAAILDILHNPEKGRTLADSGFKHIAQTFDWDVIVEKLIQEYHSV